ncbi:MAG: AAA family ATPase [Armatimonadetes bacterium]|nr:AAA family ATPase [Armatimonadota bacterium]
MNKQTLSAPGLKGYEVLGATTGFEAIPPERCKMCLSSRPGRGKSTFAMSIPNALVFDYDQGAQEVLHQRASRISMAYSKGKTVSDLHADIMQKLLTDAGPAAPFKMVVFDTLDAWFVAEVEAATAAYNKENPGAKVLSILELEDYGKARSRVYDKIQADLALLHRYGYGWLVLGHVAPTQINLPGRADPITTWGPSLGGKLPGLIYAQAEIVATLDRLTHVPKRRKAAAAQRIARKVGASVEEVKVEPVTEYVLTLASNDQYQDAKSRLRLPETDITMPDGDAWAAFVEEYEKGMVAAAELAT